MHVKKTCVTAFLILRTEPQKYENSPYTSENKTVRVYIDIAVLKPGQTIATFGRNMSQYCWEHNVCVSLAKLLCRVAACCDMVGVVGSNLKMANFFMQHYLIYRSPVL